MRRLALAAGFPGGVNLENEKAPSQFIPSQESG
jgi:hypothetical protein